MSAARSLRWLIVLTLAMLVPVPARGQLIQIRAVAPDPAPARDLSRVQPTVPKPVSHPVGPLLSLIDGSSVTGALEDTSSPDLIRWQSRPFAAPLEFVTENVSSVRWPPPKEPVKGSGDYCFELSGGDVLFGSLVAFNEKEATVQTQGLGEVRVRRSILRRIYRWRDGADLVYLGPTFGPDGMTDRQPSEIPSPSGWREDGGDLYSDTPGATLRTDVGLPPCAVVEIEMSWKQKPDFIVAIGAGKSEPSTTQPADRRVPGVVRVVNQVATQDEPRPPYRFEVLDNDIVAIGESAKAADLAPLKLEGAVKAAGRTHLLAYIDQETGRFLVVSTDGKVLADLKSGGPNPLLRGGVQLTNTKGDFRLERLRVSRWNGDPPRSGNAESPRIQRADGAVVEGEITGYDGAAKAFLVRKKGEEDETRIPADDSACVYLAPANEERPWQVRVAAQDGARLSGRLVKVEKGAVWLTSSGIEGTLQFPVARLRSLNVQTPKDPPTLKSELMGTLELEGVYLRGVLSDAVTKPGASALAWRALASKTASPLRPNVSGRIVYRETTPAPGRQAITPAPPPPPRRGLLQVLFGAAGQPATPGPPPEPGGARPSLHLRIGDVIPCDVTKIDETGVFFKSPLSDSTFVPHAKVKSVVLAPDGWGTIVLNRSKRERLLTLPRMQKDSPPTHLIRSKNGDYLRGRLISLTDKALQMEVRLDTKDLPRDRVTRITWLHPEESAAAVASTEKPAVETTRVQVMRSDGVRITFDAERFADATLSGKSDVLGVCRVPVKEMDQLLIGPAIEQASAKLAQLQWKLRDALEPKVPSEDGADPSGGTESALVGKPAPDFTLGLLGAEAKSFHLADAKGHVVMLDFWATWCGPCLQAMPQVEQVAEEFREKGVQLIAVNLEEKPEQITAMLERHKMHPTVALDRDGAVAGKYKANAIPMTVIIGPDGVVARVFVGGSPHLGDQLRDALKATLAGPPPKGAEPAK